MPSENNEAGISKQEFLNSVNLSEANEAGIRAEEYHKEWKLLRKNKNFVPQQKYELGKPLVKTQRELKALPIHQWYMKASSEGTVAFPARVKGDYYCHNDHRIWLHFKDIYDVYQQDALDITLMSVWTMQKCRKNKIWDLGFIDPELVNKDIIDQDFNDTYIQLAGIETTQISRCRNPSLYSLR
ncbi:hypothetical protein U9M48_008562 [Paspalum notatum var. saurae]|uniref:Uncharacterized protein n=1 Tax=Paspalum notatum var. saurae TaxID=547442 RepID=A0AAQ3SPU5_PASNO